LNKKASEYIKELELELHPEGGYFKEIYRSDEIIKGNSLPERYNSDRNFSTSIYFLLEGQQISKFHRLKSDEIWHFYDGSSIKIFIINFDGILSEYTLGRNIEKGEILQLGIEHDHWFAAKIIDKNSFSLIGCTVAPGFDFNDFELANREYMLNSFPQYRDIIIEFT
jgi:predicted cupin superfamily sugar epimerase